MSKKEYKKYLISEESGLVKKREIKELELSLRMIPNRLFAKDTSQNNLEKYVLKVRPKVRNSRGLLSYACENQEQELYLSRYYNESAFREFRLDIGGESLSPYECYFEDYRGIGDFNTFTVVFDVSSIKNRKQDHVFIWNDEVLKIGSLKFRIKEENITKEQAIKII